WNVGVGLWGEAVAHCWVLRDQAAGWWCDASGPPFVCSPWLGWVGVGVCVVVELDSGREHLMLALVVGGWVLDFVVIYVCVVSWLSCFAVVETSYEGHTVDALAPRADEGRRSLR